MSFKLLLFNIFVFLMLWDSVPINNLNEFLDIILILLLIFDYSIYKVMECTINMKSTKI